MKLLALFSTITCAQGLYGSGDCDGENCEISVSMPALSFRLPGTTNIQKELIRQREKFKLADNDRKRLRFEIIELRKSIEENRLESEKNSEEIKETIKNSFDKEINEKRKNLEEVFQTSMENFQLELKSSLVESVGKFGNDSTLLG
jgi:DNA anti-recombination protein RmuC